MSDYDIDFWNSGIQVQFNDYGKNDNKTFKMIVIELLENGHANYIKFNESQPEPAPGHIELNPITIKIKDKEHEVYRIGTEVYFLNSPDAVQRKVFKGEIFYFGFGKKPPEYCEEGFYYGIMFKDYNSRTQKAVDGKTQLVSELIYPTYDKAINSILQEANHEL
jgi:hypothetical protein